MTKTYNDLTPAEREAVDQRYRVADARKVLKRLPARIKRLRKIEAALRAEGAKYCDAASGDYTASCMTARALDQLDQAIQDDERRVSISSRDIEDGIDYRRGEP
jgi:hypothetical protein